MRLISVDLPLPVLPTIAVVSPGPARNEMSRRTGSSAPGIAELDVVGTRPRRAGPGRSGVTGCSGSRIIGSVSSTSRIRPAETAPRGTRMNMKTAVRTANRIWARYCRNAVRLPIDSVAARRRAIAPNQMTATVERLKIAVIVGIVIANRRLTRSEVSNRSRLAVVEALLLVPRPDERPDDAHAGQRLAHHLVDPVELDLHRPEQRDRPAT